MWLNMRKRMNTKAIAISMTAIIIILLVLTVVIIALFYKPLSENLLGLIEKIKNIFNFGVGG